MKFSINLIDILDVGKNAHCYPDKYKEEVNMANKIGKMPLYKGMEQWKINCLKPLVTRLGSCLSGLIRNKVILFNSPHNYNVRLKSFEFLKAEQLSPDRRVVFKVKFDVERDGAGPYEYDFALYDHCVQMAYNQLIKRLDRASHDRPLQAVSALLCHGFELKGIPPKKLEDGKVIVLNFGNFDE